MPYCWYCYGVARLLKINTSMQGAGYCNFQKLINTNSLLKTVVLAEKLETKRFYHRAVLHKNADQTAVKNAPLKTRLKYIIYVRLTIGPVPPNRPILTTGQIPTTGLISLSIPQVGRFFPQLGRLSNVISTNRPITLCSVTYSRVNVTQSKYMYPGRALSPCHTPTHLFLHRWQGEYYSRPLQKMQLIS